MDMATAIPTSLLLPGFDNQSLVAEVLGADATATTYLLNCPSGTDSNDCGVYNGSITLGPWASKTLPPGAAETGNFDMSMGMDTWSYSIHCEMSKTAAQKCITTNVGGNDDDHPTATFTASDDLEEYSFSYMPVTITAGQDLLSATHSASASSTGSDAKSSGASSATEATKSDGSASSSAANPKETGSAATRAVGILTVMSVAVSASIALL